MCYRLLTQLNTVCMWGGMYTHRWWEICMNAAEPWHACTHVLVEWLSVLCGIHPEPCLGGIAMEQLTPIQGSGFRGAVTPIQGSGFRGAQGGMPTGALVLLPYSLTHLPGPLAQP